MAPAAVVAAVTVAPGGVGGSPYIADYTWGDVMIHVAATSSPPHLRLASDQSGADRTRSSLRLFSPRRDRIHSTAPSDGALRCASPAVQESASTRARAKARRRWPGLPHGPVQRRARVRNYVLPNGSHCMVKRVSEHSPARTRHDRTAHHPGSHGLFRVECTDGASLQLDARFEIYAWSSFPAFDLKRRPGGVRFRTAGAWNWRSDAWLGPSSGNNATWRNAPAHALQLARARRPT